MKNKLFFVVHVLMAALIVLVTACTPMSGNLSSEQPMNEEPASKVVTLIPHDEIELDTSIPSLPAQKSIVAEKKCAAVILMYHNITTLTTPGVYDRTIQDFQADMQYLRDAGFTFIRLSEILALQAGTLIPEEGQRFASIVIDDGLISAYTRAFPILKNENIPATYFIATANINEPGFMTWAQVDEIASWSPAGSPQVFFELGSHTVDHRSLAYDPTLFATKEDYILFLNMELNQSKATLLAHVNPMQNSLFLALPYGQGADEPEVYYAALRMGYAGIRTSEYGAFNPLDPALNYRLPSAVIYGTTDIATVPLLCEPFLQSLGSVNITFH